MSELARLAAALQREPGRADVALALARAHAADGRHGLAVQLIDHARRLHPRDRELATLRVAVPFEAGRFGDATRAAVAVLRDIPDHVRVWRMAAQGFAELGMAGDAIEAWRTAIGLHPADRWPWFELGNLLLREGRRGQAVGAYREALQRGEPHAAILGNLGAALLHAGRLGAARTRLEQAVAVDPHWVPAWVSLAQVRATVGDEDGAEAAYRAALDTAPERVQTRVSYGDFLVSVGRAGHAETWFRSVLAEAPTHRGARLGLGQVLERQGHHVQAAEVLGPLVSADLDAVGPLAAWARSCIRTGQAAAALPVLTARAERPTTPTQAQLLHHTLGRLHTALGQHGAAFAAHATGNRHRERDVDPRGVVREVEGVARALPRPVQRPPGAGRGLVFIVGMPRSGTSLVEQILSRHPQVVAGGELPSLDRALREPGEPPVGSAWAERLAAEGPTAWDARGQAYLADAARRAGVAPGTVGPELRLTDKQPTNYMFLGALPRILPGARIVHCRRDPLDTCVSCFFQNLGPGHAWTTELPWLATVYRAYRRQMAFWTEAGGVEVVHVDYEAVVDDLEGQVRRLLAALDLPFHPDCLAFHESRRDARTASVDQVRQPIYRSSVGRAARYRAWLGPLVDALGDLDALPPATERVPQ